MQGKCGRAFNTNRWEEGFYNPCSAGKMATNGNAKKKVDGLTKEKAMMR